MLFISRMVGMTACPYCPQRAANAESVSPDRAFWTHGPRVGVIVGVGGGGVTVGKPNGRGATAGVAEGGTVLVGGMVALGEAAGNVPVIVPLASAAIWGARVGAGPTELGALRRVNAQTLPTMTTRAIASTINPLRGRTCSEPSCRSE